MNQSTVKQPLVMKLGQFARAVLGFDVPEATIKVVIATDLSKLEERVYKIQKRKLMETLYGGVGAVGCTPSAIVHDEIQYSRLYADGVRGCIKHTWSRKKPTSIYVTCLVCGKIRDHRWTKFNQDVHAKWTDFRHGKPKTLEL